MANRVHHTAILGDGVELGQGNVIGPYVVILGPCQIGDDNWIGPHTVVGTPPEDRGTAHGVGWDGELNKFGVRIGSRNILREHVVVHAGTHRWTEVGNSCLLLSSTHCAHDVLIGDNVTLSPAAHIAGHATLWAYANIGMSASVHQDVEVGPGAMVGMAAAVRKDVPPWSVSLGNPGRAVSLNTVGLSRMGCDEAMIEQLRVHLAGTAPVPEGAPEQVRRLLAEWNERAVRQR